MRLNDQPQNMREWMKWVVLYLRRLDRRITSLMRKNADTGWQTTGMVFAPDFAVQDGVWWRKRGDYVEVIGAAVYSGAAVTVSANGNVTDTPIITFPADLMPSRAPRFSYLTINGLVAGGFVQYTTGTLYIQAVGNSAITFTSGAVIRWTIGYTI